MHGELHGRLDPLSDIQVQRALALARARESYPLLPRDTLVQYCDAAWEAARRADPNGRDLLGAFDRALLTIAWTHRRTGGRVPLHELVEQTIPRIALQPFVAAPAAVAPDEPEEAEEPAPVESARRPVWRRPLVRVPFTSPLPVGAAVAAGAIGLTLLHETRVLPIGPLEQSANDEVGRPDGSSPRAAAGSDPAPAVDQPLASSALGGGTGDLGFGAREPSAAAADGAAAGAGTDAPAREGDGAGATGSGGGGATAPEALVASTDPADVASTEPSAPPEPVVETAPPAPPPVVTIQLPEPRVVLAYAVPPASEPVSDPEDEEPDSIPGARDDEDGDSGPSGEPPPTGEGIPPAADEPEDDERPAEEAENGPRDDDERRGADDDDRRGEDRSSRDRDGGDRRDRGPREVLEQIDDEEADIDAPSEDAPGEPSSSGDEYESTPSEVPSAPATPPAAAPPAGPVRPAAPPTPASPPASAPLPPATTPPPGSGPPSASA